MLKLAILASRAGMNRRGVESIARELHDNLPFETTVLSVGASEWTTTVPAIAREVPIHRAYTRICRALKLTSLDGRLFQRACVFNDYWLEELTFGTSLRGALDEIRPDVVLNMSGPVVGRFCRMYRRRTGVPFITRGGAGIGAVERKNVFTSPDRYIALAPQLDAFVRGFDPRLNSVVIPNGQDLHFFSPDGPAMSDDDLRALSHKPELNIEHPVVVSTSALVKFKRLDLLVRAMAEVGRGTLILAGDASDGRRIVDYGRTMLGERFAYLGSLVRTELPALYRKGDLFCFPSVNECFGNVIVEAMACGLPVVSTDDETRRWLLGSSGGLTVDPTDIRSFAECIRSASERDWGDGPRSESQRFSLEAMVERYAELIEETAGRSRTAVSV